MGLLFKELSTLYGAFVREEEDQLVELAVQYADYAVWQRKWMEGEVLKEQAEYWKKTWRVRRNCWSCLRTILVRRSRIIPEKWWNWSWTRS